MLPRHPCSEGVEEYLVAPLDLDEPGAISPHVSRDQDFCSFWGTTVTPSSSNLFYIVDIHWVNFTRRVLL
jgi:hypothetical protein